MRGEALLEINQGLAWSPSHLIPEQASLGQGLLSSSPVVIGVSNRWRALRSKVIVSLPPSRVPLATQSSADLLIARMDGWMGE